MNCSSVCCDHFLYYNLPKKKLAEKNYSTFYLNFFFLTFVLLTSSSSGVYYAKTWKNRAGARIIGVLSEFFCP